ncbi:hypothetical protein Dsin_028205 [Dipteronia sinensis]|uniref:NB-ARC domain-containing protein n=1 Tax=Dipteronia sinensis TaxID=43782 RepID=A0AAD9ZQC8_9ROSI|nr:hypothetical protein Dsin_028205 [Dipteronia sinensis]
MEFFQPIFEIINCIAPPLYKYVEYYQKLAKYMQKLKKSLDKLNIQKEEIEQRLSVECSLEKVPKNEVKLWLEKVQVIAHDVENIDQMYKKRKGFSRARLGKIVYKKIQEVKKYRQKGSSFDSLVIDAPPAIGIIFPTAILVGEATSKTMDEIWGYLMGKTTIVTHINNRLLKETDKFDNVIWVSVSQTVNLIKLQNEIAATLKIKFTETEDKIRRSGMLLEMLKGRRFVLILDGVWEGISLEELGISEAIKENRCKLVITTRSLDICRSMDCKPVEVKPLSDKEAYDLFLDKVELDILEVPNLEEIVKLVVKQCAGLPYTIATVASCMKGVHDLQEWRNTLNEVSKNVKHSCQKH